MNDFEYHAPGSLDEALELLRSTGGKALAGGQSLLPLMKLGMAEPPALVSLAGIAELREIRKEDGALWIGGATPHRDVLDSGEVRDAIPALADLASRIGDPQVRNRGTLGGSIAHADPAADYPAALVGLGATVVSDRREIGAEDFFVGMFATALEEDELIRGVRFPVPEAAGYARFTHPASRFAVAGVFVARTGGGVRVAVTGAGPSVFRVPAMEEALAGDFSAEALDGVAVDAGDLLSDEAGSAAYRAHLVTVLARRAVEACA